MLSAVCANIPRFSRSLFTGKERDAESGNDYFLARYYSSAMWRFMSPDWSAKAEPVPYAKLDNPQSLNLYAYVLNNPLSRADLDGHDWAKGGWPRSAPSKNDWVPQVPLLGPGIALSPTFAVSQV
jgi:RHS repeat-associated protein